MSKASETKTEPESAPANGDPLQTANQLPPDSDTLIPIYANFARVTSSPEELILDFGLNPQPFGNSNNGVRASQRLVLNFYNAKRLWATLGMAIQRHEQAFGVVETDVNKRLATAQRTPR
jgi:hypothetical protein